MLRDAEAGEMTKLAGDGSAVGAQGRYLRPLTQDAYEKTLRLRVRPTTSSSLPTPHTAISPQRKEARPLSHALTSD